jgi:hypothetical protein
VPKLLQHVRGLSDVFARKRFDGMIHFPHEWHSTRRVLGHEFVENRSSRSRTSNNKYRRLNVVGKDAGPLAPKRSEFQSVRQRTNDFRARKYATDEVEVRFFFEGANEDVEVLSPVFPAKVREPSRGRCRTNQVFAVERNEVLCSPERVSVLDHARGPFGARGRLPVQSSFLAAVPTTKTGST